MSLNGFFVAEDNDLKIATVSDSGRKDRGTPGTRGSLFALKELIQVTNLQRQLVYPAQPSPSTLHSPLPGGQHGVEGGALPLLLFLCNDELWLFSLLPSFFPLCVAFIKNKGHDGYRESQWKPPRKRSDVLSSPRAGALLGIVSCPPSAAWCPRWL